MANAHLHSSSAMGHHCARCPRCGSHSRGPRRSGSPSTIPLTPLTITSIPRNCRCAPPSYPHYSHSYPLSHRHLHVSSPARSYSSSAVVLGASAQASQASFKATPDTQQLDPCSPESGRLLQPDESGNSINCRTSRRPKRRRRWRGSSMAAAIATTVITNVTKNMTIVCASKPIIRANTTVTITTTPSRSTTTKTTTPTTLALYSVFLLLTMGTPSLMVAGATVSPAWRAFHGAAIVDTSMIIFGGVTDPSQNPYGATVLGSNDLWVWSTTLRQWSQPTIQSGSSSSSPAPQKFLSSIPLQSQGKMMSLVGNASSAANELLMLDSYFWVWSIPNSPNPAVSPPLRLGAAVGVSDSLVFIHGGAAVGTNGYATTGVLNDLTKLDESTFQWTSIANGPSLMYHTMCRLTGLNMMAIFGGSDQASSAYNNVHTFDLNLEVWRLSVPVDPGVGGTVPSARKGHSAVCLNNTMIVYGKG
ncbi:hypothetical protein EDD21DRAFT_93307 [Dissophora ornata]|nr:hypothetical protein EDD21DRAFT_93307 [Dissophora ornata]